MSRTLSMSATGFRVFLRVVAVLTLASLGGCAGAHVDWYAVHYARSEMTALTASPYAEFVEAEASAAATTLQQAEEALSAGQLDTAAQVSRLALLRIDYAHAVGRTRVAQAELETASKALEAAALRTDSARKELARAEEELRQVQASEAAGQ